MDLTHKLFLSLHKYRCCTQVRARLITFYRVITGTCRMHLARGGMLVGSGRSNNGADGFP
jgi:hypothetical protein